MRRTRSSALALAAAVAIGGCGGSGGGAKTQAKTSASPTTAQTAPAATSTGATNTPTSTAPGAPPPAHGQPNTTPAESGGTEPARTDVTVVGRGGRLAPAHFDVAPFIAVRVTLVSADGGSYRLSRPGLTVAADGRTKHVTATLPGIASGRGYTLTGTQRVTITATSEPGP